MKVGVINGQAKYFDKKDLCQNQYDILKASSSIPFVCKPCQVYGTPYYDGALDDPVPIEKAFALGCDRVVLMLTKPENTLRTSRKDEWFAAGTPKNIRWQQNGCASGHGVIMRGSHGRGSTQNRVG